MIIEFALPILILTALAGLIMAWGIGANDVANAMGTSVGSGAITLSTASAPCNPSPKSRAVAVDGN